MFGDVGDVDLELCEELVPCISISISISITITIIFIVLIVITWSCVRSRSHARPTCAGQRKTATLF